MNSNAEKILAKGLSAGYVGKGNASELTFPELNATYSDHWEVKRVGGGQEVATFENEMATRVYAGGIVKPEIIKSLGITETDILSYHKSKLSSLADKTRLREDVVPEADGDWQYTYQVMKDYPDLPLTIGVETITYKNRTVFVHVFLNSPIV